MNRAITLLQEEFNIKINEFAVAGICEGSLFSHKWYLGTNDTIDPEVAATKIDEFLKALNDDYRVERSEAIRNVYAEVLPLHLFYDWMKMKGKEGGANKFPRVLKNSQLEEWEKHVKLMR